ncbi:MAG: hypothetical protein ACPHRO_03385 [Nannocystaceae bacterium]
MRRPTIHVVSLCAVIGAGFSCGWQRLNPSVSPSCKRLATPFTQASLDHPALDEASGLVVSRQHPGIGWTHNDSGGEARLFAINLVTGDVVGSFLLSGISATDWEDLTLVPGRDGAPDAIVIADTGDNFRQRDDVSLHRIDEPRVLTMDGIVAEIETMRITYPDGPHDVECISSFPGGALALLTKTRTFDTTVFSIDRWHPGGVHTPAAVGSISIRASGRAATDRVTACDFSEEQGLFAMRTYDHVFLFERIRAPTPSELARTTPCVAELPEQRQGESIAITRTGSPALVVISESVDEPIWRIPLRPQGTSAVETEKSD